MSRQGNKYEKTVAFVLNVFYEGGENESLYLQEKMELPLSKKVYKVTAKNIEVYVSELLKVNALITSIRLDRISHIKIFERSK